MAKDHSSGTRNIGKNIPKAGTMRAAPTVGHNSAPKRHKHKFKIRDHDFTSECIDWAEFDGETVSVVFVKTPDAVYDFPCTHHQWKELIDNDGGGAGEYLNDELL